MTRMSYWQKDGIVVVHIEADFLAQIYGSDHIAVQTAVTQIGTKSFHLAQRVIDIETQEVKCICTSVMVAYDLKQSTNTKPLTEEWIEAICKYEGRDLRKNKIGKITLSKTKLILFFLHLHS